MRRFHLFEWEDQSWLPKVFRDFMTDHLTYTQNEPMRYPVNFAIAHRLKRVLERLQTRKIVDLCAGSGGAWPRISRILREELNFPVEVVVTDYFPNVPAFKRLEQESKGAITARFEPTSALAVPGELKGVRTLFTALHHFTPGRAQLILADAVRSRAGIAVFEPLERTYRMVGLVGLMSFLRGFTHTHRIGHLSTSRFLLTYVVPLAPALFAWDGMVSALRSYTPAELRALAMNVSDADYEWESGRFEVDGPYGSMPTTYLLGFPTRAMSPA
jgi:hypothetical protein